LISQVSVDRQALALSSYPTSKSVEVSADGVYGSLVYHPKQRIAVLYTWNLPVLPEDRTYQAWLIDEAGERVSGGIFNSNEEDRLTVVVLTSPEPLSGFVQIGVTEEPSGGSPGPTGEKVFGAEL
jgi:anti-sigma-K factor RskA